MTNKITLTREQIKEFEDDGVLCVRNLVEPVLIEKLKSELMRFVAERYKEKPPPSIHDLFEIQGFLFSELFSESSIDEIATQLLGRKAYFQFGESFLKPATTGKKIFQHQDEEYFCFRDGSGLNAITALDPANHENGGIYYYIGSHKRTFPHQTLAIKTYSVDDSLLQPYKKIQFDLKPGDCVFHHIKTVHGSEDNKSPHPRRTITRLYSIFEKATQPERVNAKIKQAFAELAALQRK